MNIRNEKSKSCKVKVYFDVRKKNRVIKPVPRPRLRRQTVFDSSGVQMLIVILITRKLLRICPKIVALFIKKSCENHHISIEQTNRKFRKNR